MASAEVNGHAIPYEDSGGTGLPVVPAHGFFMDAGLTPSGPSGRFASLLPDTPLPD
jgi:hypothetical protein